jgi:hypothetical protein
MDAYRIALKFFLDESAAGAIDRERFVPMFQLWIRDQIIAGHMLIDVADYLHVTHGPGVVLISHEANIGMDEGEGKLGLLYQRKRPMQGTFAERLELVMAAALESCHKVEHDTTLGHGVKFRTDEFVLKIQDRLLAPNDESTLNAIRGDLERLLGKMYCGAKVALEQRNDPAGAFEVRVKIAASPTVAEVIDRLELPAMRK